MLTSQCWSLIKQYRAQKFASTTNVVIAEDVQLVIVLVVVLVVALRGPKAC